MFHWTWGCLTMTRKVVEDKKKMTRINLLALNIHACEYGGDLCMASLQLFWSLDAEYTAQKWDLPVFCPEDSQQCTEVCFASFLSGGFTILQ